MSWFTEEFPPPSFCVTITIKCLKASCPKRLMMNLNFCPSFSVKSEGFTNSSRTFGPGWHWATHIFISCLTLSLGRLKTSAVFTTVTFFFLQSLWICTYCLDISFFPVMTLLSVVFSCWLFPNITILSSSAVKQCEDRHYKMRESLFLSFHFTHSYVEFLKEG